jgi:hypothetical protein
MKNHVRLLAIFAMASVFSIAFSGCATTSKVTTPVISVVKDCADATTHAVAAGILDDVSSILVCDSGSAVTLPACVISQLAAVAKTAGWAAVDCVIAEIQQKASANVAASEDTTENLRVRRATAAIAWRASPDGGAATSP